MEKNENLFPEDRITLDEAEIFEAGENETIFKEGLAVHAVTNDFILDGSGNIITCSAVDSWKQWCKKTLETKRYECIAFSDDIGMDTSGILEEDRAFAESLLSGEIIEALEADPCGRTAYVESVTFNWLEPDAVEVTVTAQCADGSAEEITAKIEQ